MGTAVEEFAMPDPADVPADMMADYLQKLFKVADTNDDGVLSPVEFADLLSRSGFNFPAHVVVSLVKAADVNEDGMIEYEEFVPAMLGLMEAANEADLQPEDGVIQYEEFMPAMLAVIDALRDGEDVDAPVAADAPVVEDDDLDRQAREFLLKGMPRDKLERAILRSFLFADTKNIGVLDESEFAACIQDLGLGLSPVHIAELMVAVDKNEDGVIAYDEWVPLAFELMVRTVKKQLADAKPTPAPVTEPVTGSWTAIAKSYTEPLPRAPVARPALSGNKGPTPELEGRVHALQSRRLLRQWVKDLFSQLDTDMDGRLSEDEIASQAGRQMAKDMIAAMDRNKDGKLSQVEMRDFFDAEAARATEEKGIPEWEFLDSVVKMLGIDA